MRGKSIPCFAKDEGRPLGLGIQVQGSNNLKLLCSKGMVVSVKEKAGNISHVRVMELNESEGPKKYRKSVIVLPKPGVCGAIGISPEET